MTPGNLVGGSLDRTLATLDYRDQPPMMNRPDIWRCSVGTASHGSDPPNQVVVLIPEVPGRLKTRRNIHLLSSRTAQRRDPGGTSTAKHPKTSSGRVAANAGSGLSSTPSAHLHF